ncbi:hypothetical protein CK203_029682 [Vitis vinifera]|uniref:Uncharacterized protein n=1 Tax=Vitis vinifera TaxID=29760 RepID=A0A438II82_VITVI|nr:hypothetical protein CK203_029682 [Vitis vinifera]
MNYFFQVEYELFGWVSMEEVCVSLGIKEKPTNGIRCHLIDPRPWKSTERGDGLMLFNYNEFIPTSAQEIHLDLFGREYRNVIDGEEVTITNLEAKFVPRG